MNPEQPGTPWADCLPGRSAQESEMVPSTKAGRYEIKVEGHLDEHWSEWLGGLAISHYRDGDTMLTGIIRDQAALFGILLQIRDLGLALISLKRVENSQASMEDCELNDGKK